MPAAIPALAELAGFLVAVMVLFAAYLMLVGYRYTLGMLLGAIADAAGSAHVPFLPGAIRSLDNKVKAALGHAVDGAEWAVVGLWLGSAALFLEVVNQIEGLAHDVAGAFDRTASHGIRVTKKWVLGAIGGALAASLRALHRLYGGQIAALGRLITAIHRAIAGIHKTVAVLERELGNVRGFTAKQLRALLRRLAAFGWLAAFAGAGALVGAGLGKLHLRWLLTYRGAAALVGAGLAALGLSWLRCSNTGKIGKRLCGNEGNLLNALMDDLLAAGVDVLLITHLCELMSTVTHYGSVVVDAFLPVLLEAEGYVCAGRDGAASGIVDADWRGLSGLASGL